MKKITSLFSLVACIAITTMSLHTHAASDNVKNKSGTECSISECNAPAFSISEVDNANFVFVVNHSENFVFIPTENIKNYNAPEIATLIELETDVSYHLNLLADLPYDNYSLKNSGLFSIENKTRPVKQFDLVTHPRICKFISYSMAFSRC